MADNYATIVQDNLNQLYANLPEDLEKWLPGERDGDRFIFDAFGEKCLIEPKGITLGTKDYSSVFGILISLYAINARPDICVPKLFKAFKEFPDSMPYVSAFTTHTEQLLIPHVAKIKESMQIINEKLMGEGTPEGTGGDFSFIVYPLPKIALC